MSVADALARVDAITARINAVGGIQSGVAAGGPVNAGADLGVATTTPFAKTLATASQAQRAAETGTSTGTLPADGDGAVPAELRPLIQAAAKESGLDPELVAAVARAESGFRVDAGSPAGARGLMQLMPSTAASLGVTNILDPAQNLRAGSRYLKQQIDTFGDLRLALAAYNAGPGAVRRYGGVPPYAETQTYVTRVLGYYDRYRD